MLAEPATPVLFYLCADIDEVAPAPFRRALMSTPKPGVLALEDGSVFRGLAYGAAKTITGECVFNTSMTGYQEILTDPSYCGQIITMTAPQIGNYGLNAEDNEAGGPKCSGLIVRELSPVVSNWRATISLPDYLAAHGIPCLSEIDTRALTKKLRVEGAMRSCLSTLPLSDAEAVALARSAAEMQGSDYVREVTCREPYLWHEDAPENHNAPYLPAGTTLGTHTAPATRYRVAAFDFGAKHTIFRKLVRHGFDVQVFPADAPAALIREHAPDALFLSNGPGDPAALPYIHKTVTALLGEFPTFGICLGHQMLTYALGGHTFKLKFGHRGGNLPVKNLETGKVSRRHRHRGQPKRRHSRGAPPPRVAHLLRPIPPRSGPRPQRRRPALRRFPPPRLET